MNLHQIDWSTMEWQPVREGVDRKAFTGAGATVALHRLMPGHQPSPHQHPHARKCWRPHSHPHHDATLMLVRVLTFLFVSHVMMLL
jgi:hypothetical protein